MKIRIHRIWNERSLMPDLDIRHAKLRHVPKAIPIRHKQPKYGIMDHQSALPVCLHSKVLLNISGLTLFPIRFFLLSYVSATFVVASQPSRPFQMDSDDLFLRLQEWSSRIQQKVDEYKVTVEALKNLMVVVRACSAFRFH